MLDITTVAVPTLASQNEVALRELFSHANYYRQTLDIAGVFATRKGKMEVIQPLQRDYWNFEAHLKTVTSKVSQHQIKVRSVRINEDALANLSTASGQEKEEFIVGWVLHQLRLFRINLQSVLDRESLPSEIQTLVEDELSRLGMYKVASVA